MVLCVATDDILCMCSCNYRSSDEYSMTATLFGEEPDLHYCKKCKTNQPIFDFETRVRGKCGEKPLNHCKTCRKKAASQLAYLKKYNNAPDSDYVCPLCLRGKENLGYTSAFVLDHNHTSGEARGWICHDCNNALDRMGDDANTARRMVEYLESNDRGRYLGSVEMVDRVEDLCGLV